MVSLISRYIPRFFYESLWNLILLILLILFTRHKRFDGEVFLLYLAGYGIGRFWIESLRTGYSCCCRSSDIRCLWHLQHFLWSYRFPGSSSGMSASTKKQHNVHLDGKILHTFPRVEDFLKKRQLSAHFQERPGITLDFRGLLGYYGYIVVESGIKNPLCGVKW